ncbi:MAG TPA: zinc ribbon domain-containing protein [Candidatus Margulisiibacteriota bacterium]|nr:zinc ribbon domain-containing protein [Candidatus Margulisiibacteriota bacterium]
MPIYEYRCRKCGEFEVTQRITEPPLARCPTCRGKVTKLISNTSFQLKGSGWYITDYGRADGKGKEKGTEAKAESKTESKAESKTESKSESVAKGESKSDSSSSKSKEVAAA